MMAQNGCSFFLCLPEKFSQRIYTNSIWRFSVWLCQMNVKSKTGANQFQLYYHPFYLDSICHRVALSMHSDAKTKKFFSQLSLSLSLSQQFMMILWFALQKQQQQQQQFPNSLNAFFSAFEYKITECSENEIKNIWKLNLLLSALCVRDLTDYNFLFLFLRLCALCLFAFFHLSFSHSHSSKWRKKIACIKCMCLGCNVPFIKMKTERIGRWVN